MTINPTSEFTAPNEPNHTQPLKAAIDLAGALDRVEGDREFLAELAEIFLQEMNDLLATMDSSAVTNDAKAIGRTAHTLKGAAANFCADELQAIAWQLEQLGNQGAIDQIPAVLAALRGEAQRVEQTLRAEFP